MQQKQLKRPYLAPEITTVEFAVERGLQGSGPTVNPQIELNNLQMGKFQNNEYFMGSSMDDFSGYFVTPPGQSGSGEGSSYFPTVF